MKCEDCKYFDDGIVTQPNAVDMDIAPHCRRYAPRIICGGGTGWSNQLFPKVHPDDWCGEFEKK